MTTDFLKKYNHKLKTRTELLDIIGAPPRSSKVIMCHGVFDVVHPVHIRHLNYARSKADILIASLTTDQFIEKGAYRPHVPEIIRAQTLAAFEMVDYVIIDYEAKPLSNIIFLKPDFFAKGFEYSSNLPDETQEEVDLVESYGGQMLFTPGDVVYSSSNFIEMAPPNLDIEKLISLMNQYEISFQDLYDSLNKLQDLSVHVVGDTIIDSYTRTTLIGGQTKTPTLSVRFEDKDDYIGGAGIVALHLVAAGAKVSFTTVLGDDKLKDFSIKGLTKAGVKVNAIIDPTRPTTNKNAIIAGGYRLLKVDTLDNRVISKEITAEIKSHVSNVQADAVVFSDFRHGIFNKETAKELSAVIPKGVFSVADSQVASRWGNITDFKNFDLITPNEREARFALADQDSTVGSLSNSLSEQTGCKLLILKLGEKGIFVNRNLPNDEINYFSIGSFTDKVLDAVGAGDALLAYSTLTMLATGSEVITSIIGSIAAACECEIDGNVPIKIERITQKLSSIQKKIEFK